MKHFLLSLRLAVMTVLSLCAVGVAAESVTLSATTVGATDNTTAFFGAKSDVVAIPAGKQLTFSFINNNGGSQVNYENWILAVVNTSAHSTDDNSAYAEYFVLRPDNWGWGGGIAAWPYSAQNLAVSGYDWASFPAHMDGAQVDMTIKHFADGIVLVEAKMTNDGVTICETYHQACPADEPVYAYLSVEKAHLTGLSADVSDCVRSYSGLAISHNADVKYWLAAGASSAPVVSSAVSVFGVRADGGREPIAVGSVSFSGVAADGSFTASYAGREAQGNAVVAVVGCSTVGTDLTTAFNSVASDYAQVRSGETKTVSFQLRSDNAANWHCPVVILRTADKAEYATLRADNFGYRETLDNNIATEGATLDSNWDWDFFASSLDGSVYTLTVSNYADSVAVLMDVVDGRGQARHQYFHHVGKGNTANAGPDDLYFGVTTEAAYLLFAPQSSTALRPSPTDCIDVVAGGGRIDVVGADSFDVYDLKGRRVAPRGLAPGLYVVCAGGVARRVMVR